MSLSSTEAALFRHADNAYDAYTWAREMSRLAIRNRARWQAEIAKARAAYTVAAFYAHGRRGPA